MSESTLEPPSTEPSSGRLSTSSFTRHFRHNSKEPKPSSISDFRKSSEATPRISLQVNISTSISRTVQPASSLRPSTDQDPSKPSAPRLSGETLTSTTADQPWIFGASNPSHPSKDSSLFNFSSSSSSSSYQSSSSDAIQTTITHSTTRAALYQLSSPLTTRCPRITLSRYTDANKKLYSDDPDTPSNNGDNGGRKRRKSLRPAEDLYDIISLPALGGSTQIHRCEIRAHRPSGLTQHRAGGTVQLGVSIFTGVTVNVSFGGKTVLKCAKHKWRDEGGGLVATVAAAEDDEGGKSKGRGKGRQEIEFEEGVEHGVRDLCVAAWCAGLWLRNMVPKVEGVRGRKESHPLRDEAVKEGWKKGSSA